MRRERWFESNWAAVCFILVAQLVLPLLAFTACPHRSGSGPDVDYPPVENDGAYQRGLPIGEPH